MPHDSRLLAHPLAHRLLPSERQRPANVTKRPNAGLAAAAARSSPRCAVDDRGAACSVELFRRSKTIGSGREQIAVDRSSIEQPKAMGLGRTAPVLGSQKVGPASI